MSQNTTLRQINDDEFDQLVASSDIPVVVDFWAPWCGPCNRLAPTLAKLAPEYQGRLMIVKLNVEEHRRQSSRFRVKTIPTLLVFDKGDKVDTRTGGGSEHDLREYFDTIVRSLSQADLEQC